jgi:SRSO17 transposase
VFRSWGKKQLIGGTAAKVAQSLPKSAWRCLSSGEGTKGPRLHDWAYLELADLDVAQYNSTLTGQWTRGLLIRRNIADGAMAFFSTWCPKGTPAKKMIAVEGRRWAIEDSFESAKNELGLDHNESRSWHGWHRHVSLVMLAFAMMPPSVITPMPRRSKNTATPSQRTPLLICCWSVQEIRRIAIKLTQQRIQPAHVIAWSLWRRAHQVEARRAHLKRKMQL